MGYIQVLPKVINRKDPPGAPTRALQMHFETPSGAAETVPRQYLSIFMVCYRRVIRLILSQDLKSWTPVARWSLTTL